MSTSKLDYDVPFRPRLDPELKSRIDSLANRLKINNMSLSAINNILASIGIEAIERSLDHVVEELKNSELVKNYIKIPPKS